MIGKLLGRLSLRGWRDGYRADRRWAKGADERAWRRDAIAELEPPLQDLPDPCPEGFYWIGQPWNCCEKCGLPAWEHAGMAQPPAGAGLVYDGPMVLQPWRPGYVELLKARWAPQ